MRNIAVVGIEGVGKTAFLAAFGLLGADAGADGLRWTPAGPATEDFQARAADGFRRGAWPFATTGGFPADLAWSVSRDGAAGCGAACGDRIAALDFPGAAAAVAFDPRAEIRTAADISTANILKRHVGQADALLLMLDLARILNGGADAERQVRVARGVLKAVRGARVAVALARADLFPGLIASSGGPAKALARFAPEVAQDAGDVPVLPVACAKTRTDEQGRVVPVSAAGADGDAGFLAAALWLLQVI